ncbi:hypothetical protein V9K67_26890 [Paraflavisolibacter sp. H34]|uniref:hypothetical protein n=1 Tax=Huijunlia imazamoxiresistens TaxID=3127457 RepID=UPI003015A4BE
MASILLFLLSSAVIGQVQKCQLRNGVYYAARISKIASGKSGPHYYIEYIFNDKRYTGSFLPFFDYKPNREGAYIFIKLLPHNPAIHQHLDEGEVVDSLLKVMPVKGWKTLPNTPRQYLLNGHYIQYK